MMVTAEDRLVEAAARWQSAEEAAREARLDLYKAAADLAGGPNRTASASASALVGGWPSWALHPGLQGHDMKPEKLTGDELLSLAKMGARHDCGAPGVGSWYDAWRKLLKHAAAVEMEQAR